MLAALGVAFLGAVAWKALVIVAMVGSLSTAGQGRPQGDTLVKRTVPVPEAYRLAWASHSHAAALEMLVASADLPLNGDEREPRIGETRDGPLVLDVVVPSAQAAYATLRLHRHDANVEDDVFDALEGKARPAQRGAPSMPHAFWVEGRDGNWKVLGWECEAATPLPPLGCGRPEAPLARWMPTLFGIQRVAFHAASDRANARCDMSFRYRGRVATVSTRERCGTEASGAAFVEGVEALARMSGDARIPPDAAERERRLQAALGRCDAAAAALRVAASEPARHLEGRARLDATCDYAIRLAAPRLQAEPAAAGRAMLRAMHVRFAAGGSPLVDRSGAVLEALERAGEGRSADAAHAQALRVSYLRNQGKRDESHAPLEALLALAPELPPDAPAFAPLERIAATSDFEDAYKARYLAVLAARHAKAAAAPGSPLELRLRYALCTQRMYWNLERETLKECAESLLAAWPPAATAEPAAPFDKPEYAAKSLGSMHVSYAYAAQDFAGGAAGVGEVLRQATERIPATPQNEWLFGELRARQAELTSRASPPRPHAAR